MSVNQNIFSCLSILLSISFLTSCTPIVHHADPFNNYNDSDFPWEHLPVIKPIEAIREKPSKPWSLELLNTLLIKLPKSQEQEVDAYYGFTRVWELEKFAVKDGVIMAYSSYVDKDADAYVQDNYYHWFVMVMDKDITQGFQTEDEFRQYIQTLGIQEPDWLTPDDAFKQFLDTGCLEWFPDCK